MSNSQSDTNNNDPANTFQQDSSITQTEKSQTEVSKPHWDNTSQQDSSTTQTEKSQTELSKPHWKNTSQQDSSTTQTEKFQTELSKLHWGNTSEQDFSTTQTEKSQTEPSKPHWDNTSQQDSSTTQTEKSQTELSKPHWDADADVFALAENKAGKTASQISSQLCLRGYTVSEEDATKSLRRQGVKNVVWQLWEHPAAFFWDSRADAFVLDAYGLGQTVSEIAAQLSTNGYVAPVAQVMESLNKQGVHVD